MKRMIATALALTIAGIAQAHSFDYERQVGAPELYSTLNTDGIAAFRVDSGSGFAYQEAAGSQDLFPTLGIASDGPVTGGGQVTFAYHAQVGSSELDPHI